MKNTSNFIKIHPRSEFDKINKNKYILYYEEKSNKTDKRLFIQVKKNVLIAGEADFYNDKYHLHCENVEVKKKHRRKGIANAMYVFAEAFFDKKIINFWDDAPKRSDLIKKFWNQPDRPFG